MNRLRRCHDCGQPIGAKDRFCPRCGAKQPREPGQRPSSDRHAAPAHA